MEGFVKFVKCGDDRGDDGLDGLLKGGAGESASRDWWCRVRGW